MEQRELDSYIEVVSDISMEVGATLYCSGKNSVEVKRDIRTWADEFMVIYKQTDWEEVDYLEQVLDFTHKKIDAEIERTCDPEKLSAGEYIIRKDPCNEQKKRKSKDEKMQTDSQTPKLKCPQCGAEVIFDEAIGRYTCESCEQQWDNDIYVFVGYNEIDAFEDEETEEDSEIGYASYTSEDNSARYIPLDEYVNRLGKIPNVAECYEVVTWPDSQMVMEASDFEEECEAIFDEVGLEIFGSMACWTPVNWLKSFKKNQK